jgi:hypothetical protein
MSREYNPTHDIRNRYQTSHIERTSPRAALIWKGRGTDTHSTLDSLTKCKRLWTGRHLGSMQRYMKISQLVQNPLPRRNSITELNSKIIWRWESSGILPWWWRQYELLKRRSTPTRPHGATSQKAHLHTRQIYNGNFCDLYQHVTNCDSVN